MTVTLARRIPGFEAVVSPYHLTTREPAAMVTLQLAERAVTLLLAPAGEGVAVEYASVRREAARNPAYARYMESWQWAQELFREGLIDSLHAGDDPIGAVRGVCDRLMIEDRYESLLAFMRPGLFEDERAYLLAASADVLKAGPDPSVSIPIAAGLDAFAASHDLVIARSAPASLAQKAEVRLGTRVFGVTVPALLQASAERVLLTREVLDGERAVLAREITAAFEGGPAEPLRAAARAYAAAFDREQGEICAPPGRDEEDEVRVIVGEVSVQGVALPRDAVLRSSMMAATRRTPASIPPSGGGVRTLVVRPLGAG